MFLGLILWMSCARNGWLNTAYFMQTRHANIHAWLCYVKDNKCYGVILGL
jgi:hypothetical protein